MINFRFFLTCGNSSAVEHDLAKVGVASSNLVSRSIVFLLLITTFTFANDTLKAKPKLYNDKIDIKYTSEKYILSGSEIVAYLRDGMLVIQIDAILLEDASIGDVVQIKTDKAKLFRAKLVSKNKAIILE